MTPDHFLNDMYNVSLTFSERSSYGGTIGGSVLGVLTLGAEACKEDFVLSCGEASAAATTH